MIALKSLYFWGVIMRVCKNEKNFVLEAIRQGKMDSVAGGFDNLIDDIILHMQQHVLPARYMSPNIHILDCTKLEVNLNNENYELSEVVKDQDGVHRGYKMGNLRGLTGDSGVLEEVV